MAGRGRTFSLIEENILKNNFDKTIVELEELLIKQGYRRTRKSINRKLEKMREEGDVGFRSKNTVKRSYKQRTRNKKPEAPETQWRDDAGSGFNTGVGWDVE